MIDNTLNNIINQPPASQAFRSGQAPTQPRDQNPTVQRAPEAINTTNASLSTGIEAEISEKVALSRDQARPDPNRVSSSVNRGTALDISV